MEERPVLTLEEFEERLKTEERYIFKNRTIEDLRPFVEKANELEKPLLFEYCDIRIAYFADATIKVDFSVEGCHFQAGTDFRSSEFCCEAAFLRARFSGWADFRGTQFSGRVNFVLAKFPGVASFHKTNFSGETYFGRAKFSGRASFVEARFLGLARFDYAEFSAITDFRWAKFSGEAFFWGAEFSSQAIFEEAQFLARTNFRKAQFLGWSYFQGAVFAGDANFSVYMIGFMDLAGATIEKRFDISRLDICNFGILRFDGLLNNGRLFLPLELLLPTEEPRSTLINEIDGDFEKATEEYGLLYDNYKRIPHYEKEQDHAYYKFREMGRKALCEKWKKNFNLWDFIKWGWDKFAVSLCFGYGVKIWNVVGTALFIMSLSTVNYMVFSKGISVSKTQTLHDLLNEGVWKFFWNSIYFSGITFATIGYGDFAPTCLWNKIWCAGEGLLGIFMMALFIVTFGRKLLR